MQTPMLMTKPNTDNLITVDEYAKRKGKNLTTVYRRIKTIDTPNGDIEAIFDGVWKIDWNKFKDVKFKDRINRKPIDETKI